MKQDNRAVRHEPVVPAAVNSGFRNEDAEQMVIGTILKTPEAILDIGFLEPHDFTNVFLANTYYVLLLMQTNGKKPNAFTVIHEMRSLGEDFAELAGEIEKGQYLLNIMQNTPNMADNIANLAAQIRELSCSRQAVAFCDEFRLSLIQSEGTNLGEFQSILLSKLDGLSQSNINLENHMTGGQLLRLGFENYQKELDREHNKEYRGDLHTGFKHLDNYIQGLSGGDLVVVAGRPAMGKTVFANQVAENMAKQLTETENQAGIIVCFSLEMTEKQMAVRKMAAQTGISISELNSGYAGENGCNLDRVSALIAEIPENEHRIHYDFDSKITVRMMRSKLRFLERKYGKIKGIVFDYLQLMRDIPPHLRHNWNEVANISWISSEFKSIAKEFACPFITLSQLSRQVESRPDKRPMLSDLRGSGAIEQDADMVIFLYRDEYYNPDSKLKASEIIIAKQRQGVTGTAFARFEGQYNRFAELDAFEHEEAMAVKGMQSSQTTGGNRFQDAAGDVL